MGQGEELVKGPGEGLPWDGTEDPVELEARTRSGLCLEQVQPCVLSINPDSQSLGLRLGTGDGDTEINMSQ